MSKTDLLPLKNIGRDIKIALEQKAFGGALILTYAAIDAMAFLSMPDNQKDVRSKDYINWIEKYMQTDSTQPYQYRGIDIYGARCGLIHRYGPHSSLSDKGECKIFAYQNGKNHIYNPSKDPNFVLLSWGRFIQDFFDAVKKFLFDIEKDKLLYQRVSNRINHLFYIEPV